MKMRNSTSNVCKTVSCFVCIGDTVKTKLESSGGDWRFGFKKTAFGLKKTWGVFPTSAVAK